MFLVLVETFSSSWLSVRNDRVVMCWLLNVVI